MEPHRDDVQNVRHLQFTLKAPAYCVCVAVHLRYLCLRSLRVTGTHGLRGGYAVDPDPPIYCVASA